MAAFLKTAISMGANFVDTAEYYGTDEIVGRAIRGIRSELSCDEDHPAVIQRKCSAAPCGWYLMFSQQRRLSVTIQEKRMFEKLLQHWSDPLCSRPMLDDRFDSGGSSYVQQTRMATIADTCCAMV